MSPLLALKAWAVAMVLLVAGCPRTTGQVIFDDQERVNLDAIRSDFLNGPALTDTSLRSWDLSTGVSSSCECVGVTCNNDGFVTEIDLAGYGLFGTLDPIFGQLPYLERLTLSNNYLYGPIPDALSALTNLTLLNLSNNNFTGEIPDFLGTMPKMNGTTDLNLANNSPGFSGTIPLNVSNRFCADQFAGNPDLNTTGVSFPSCTGPVYQAPPSPPPSKGGVNVGALVGGIVGGLAALLIVCTLLFIYWLHHRQAGPAFQKLSQEELNDIEAGFTGTSLTRIKRYSLHELRQATDNFSDFCKVGEGGFSIVYKANLGPDDSSVAIKRLKNLRVGRIEMVEFLNEIDTISCAVHRNVLKLAGYCMEEGERITVFPYMENGSVRDHLQGRPPGVPPLSLDLRRYIAIGAAQGLSYLHDDCAVRIIHRDVKAANILLNVKFEPAVADFGLAKLLDIEGTHVSTAVRGTLGHIAPEYIATGQISHLGDVYSFGVFLLELITGKDAVTLSQGDDIHDDLRNWFSSTFQEGRLAHVVDVELRLIDIDMLEGEYQTEVLEDLVQVALLCLAEDPKQRPTMADVVRLLQGEGLEEAWNAWGSGQEVADDHHVHSQMSSAVHGSSLSSGFVQGSTDVSMVGYNLSGPR